MSEIIQLNSQAKLSEHLASPSEATLGMTTASVSSRPSAARGEISRLRSR